MRSSWSVFTEPRAEAKALAVFERVLRELGGEPWNRSIEPYPKTGSFVIRFEIELGGGAWNDCVVEVIEMGQRVAHAWTLTGDIRDDPSGWSNEPTTPGIKAVTWVLIRPQEGERMS